MGKVPADESTAVVFDLLARHLRNVMLRLPTEAEGVGGVTTEQWSALVELRKGGPDGLTMGELAGRRGMALNSASALVERLVQQGLVERRGDTADRRVVRARLTPEGEHLVAAVAARRRAAHEALLARLSPEHRQALEAAVPALARLAELAGGR